MILPDYELRRWACSGGISPYDYENVNPGSVDLRLGNQFIDLHTGNKFTSEEVTLKHGDAILASTIEFIKMPKDCCGTVYLKSSLARLGLDHSLAGWVDAEFFGELTLELHAHREITLKHNQRVLQLVLHKMTGIPERTYQQTGRYNNQTGPTASKNVV